MDVSETPVHFNRRGELLVARSPDGEETTIPFTDIAAVVVGHPQVTFTQDALAGLSGSGAMVVVCDDKRNPAGMFLPLDSHFTQGARFERQAVAPLPLRKQLWKAIVSAKIASQGRLLATLGGDDAGLVEMSRCVRSGDAGNLESQAAVRYWPRVFGVPSFRRDREAQDQNRFLNYGYAVLRAAVARALCGAGLHPSLGLHHHNRYDTFRLASDVMEPFRTIVDRAVVALVAERGAGAPPDKTAKSALIQSMLSRLSVGGEERTFFDIASKTAQSLAGIFEGTCEKLFLPEL
jgi:CRISPR-associated protein Cas1